jgi:type II secretory pathway component GspD/PulD (secretin)
VFTLKFADAKSLATVVKELFTGQQDQSRNNDPRSRFFNFMRGGGRDGGGGGGPPGFGGGDMGGGGGSVGGGRAPTPRVVAVADERSNSLVVSAPEEQMPIIEDLVRQVDTNVEDITELRVFRLKHADAQETADLLTSLFPDNSTTQGTRSRFQFGGRSSRFGGMFGGPAMGGGATANGATSERAIKETRVVAVPDLRTRSVVVSAARDLMPQIASMIEELDADPAKKQKVFVYSLENTDPQAVQELLQGMFPSQNYNRGGYGSYGNTRNTSRQTGNQLNNRANQRQSQGFGRSSGSGFGTSGSNPFGSGGMGGR